MLEMLRNQAVGMTFDGLTEDDVLSISAAYGEPEWVRDRRLEAFKAFSDLPWPTGREEEWRYTKPQRFDLARELSTSPGDAPAVSRGIVALRTGERAALARIVDGGVVEANVSDAAAACTVHNTLSHPPRLTTDVVTLAEHDEQVHTRTHSHPQ